MIVGVDQGTYSVSAGTRQFTVSGLNFDPSKEGVLMILNITQDKLYYAAAQSFTKSLTITEEGSSNSFIFEYSPIFQVLGVNDVLHIQLQDETALATESNQDTLNSLITALNALVTVSNQKILTDDKVHVLLQQIRDGIALPPWYVDTSNSLNTSGTSTVTFAANQDIRTVTTLTGQTNIGGFSADLVTENNTFEDWGISVRALLI